MQNPTNETDASHRNAPILSDAADEPHRVVSVDIRYVSKTSYPDLQSARDAAIEMGKKYGGLWFACNESYFNATPGATGTTQVTVIP